MSPPNLQSETARQRELYKYWQPNESVFPSADYDESFNHNYQPQPSYDSALTAYAQLGALRCNAKRGMISVVDQNYQYIIAEGTKTLSLQDGTVVDQDDQLWFGLRSIPRSVGICAMALGQFTTVEEHDGSISNTLFEPLQFIIPDLSKDPRFTNQPFVCGPPYLRFYAGVPIRSPAGYIIGIYSIVDDKPRYNFGEYDLSILKDLAATVMDHLVLGTVRGRHHRADMMVKGLGLFVEGKSTLRDWWLRSGYLANGPTTKDGSKGGWSLKAQADAEFGPQLDLASSDHMLTQHDGDPFQKEKTTVKQEGGERSVSPLSVDPVGNTQSSEMILKSLLSCGEINLEVPASKPTSDTKSSYKVASQVSPAQTVVSDITGSEDEDILTNPTKDTSTISQDMEAMFKRASNLIRESITVEGCLFLEAGPEDPSISPSIERRESSTTTPTWSSTKSMCEVLGSSSRFKHHTDDGEGPKYQFPKDFLHRMVKRCPNGCILNFENDGSISSGEDDISSSCKSRRSSRPKSRRRGNDPFKGHDMKIIMDVFPGIRCLAFFPLWDTSTKSWFCGALAWTNDPLRVLDPDDDMAYLAAFGNSIMAEKARLDASMADRMKSNFISTVSHELRSPLHGILASVELLKDMTIVPAQIDVISMINVCGRTLLDTINHVLDFTELNRPQKSKATDKEKTGNRRITLAHDKPASSLANQTEDLDLSILVEEVVESTLAGYSFGQANSNAEQQFSSQLPSSIEMSQQAIDLLSRGRESGVQVIMDIDWRSNWVFAFQPGALRRIIMNLFGNALKYTKKGQICVSLKTIDSISSQDGRPSVILDVTDTGKGISNQYLKHHVFTPFSQEDTLAIGTGLGLSIVQRIVHDLNGQIVIKSEKGSGTKVTVQIPLNNPTQLAPLKHSDDSNLEIVKEKMKGMKVCIYSSKNLPEGGGKENAHVMTGAKAASSLSVGRSLRKTLKNWFEVEIVEDTPGNPVEADIYMVLEDEHSISRAGDVKDSFDWKSELIHRATSNASIVLCTASASSNKIVSERWKQVSCIQQPFGPRKLAKIFDAFLQKRISPVDPPISPLDSLSMEDGPLVNVGIDTKLSDDTSSLANDTTNGTDIHLNSHMNTSTTINTVFMTAPQLPISSQLPSVLLVEDNEINLKLLVMYMRKLKYPYQTAINGLEALEIFKKNPLPLRFILMDISMPIMDGLTSTREIRKHEREFGLPPATILALTGASSVNAREKAILSGVNQFLTKPVPLTVVKDFISGWPQHAIEIATS